MHSPESVQENETHKILWNLEIKVDYFILVGKPDIELINKKKNLSSSRFCCSCRTQSKNVRKRKYMQIFEPWNMILIEVGAPGTMSKSLGEKTGRFRNHRKKRYYPDCSIKKIDNKT